jgi:hypothetical protein
MRHSQDTGSDTHWSAAHSSQQLAIDLSPSHLLHGVSPDVLVAVAGLVAITVSVVGYLTSRAVWRGLARGRRRNREALTETEGRKARLFSGIGPQAVVAAGGVCVSIHGLWGFATGTAKLPDVLAVGFIGTFDLAEMVLFGMLYRAADPEVGWTDELRLMHKTAWTLVGFSSAMNAVHAPNWWARPVLAAIPALAAWLIELQLRAKLTKKTALDTSARPGPLLLLRRIWQHAWSWLFAVFNLDADASNGQISRGALAQRAAHQAYRLRNALQPAAALQAKADRGLQLSRSEQKQLKELAPLRRRAQLALDNSAMGVDAELTLDVFRRLTTLIRVDDVAMIPGTPEKTIAMAEELAVVPAAQLIAASKRAEEKAAEAERSEAARQEAERARLAELEALEEIRSEQRRAEAARLTAEEIARKALLAAEKAEAEAERSAAARQQAEDARQRSVDEMAEMSETAAALKAEAEAEEKRLADAADRRRRQEEAGTSAAQKNEDLEAELARARTELQHLASTKEGASDAAQQAVASARAAEEKLEELRRQTKDLETMVTETVGQAERASDLRREKEREAREWAELAAQREADAEARQRAVREAEAALARLRQEVREQLPAGTVLPVEVPVFAGSAAKQLAWEEYLKAVSQGRTPDTPGEIAAATGNAESTVRNWMVEFRQKRTEMIAAGVEFGTEHRARAAEQQPSANGGQPSSSRASGLGHPEETSSAALIAGQRQAV